MNMSERTTTSREYGGITIRPDNPNTPYDDSEIVNSLTLSEETVNKSFTGTGYNPEARLELKVRILQFTVICQMLWENPQKKA